MQQPNCTYEEDENEKKAKLRYCRHYLFCSAA